MELSETQGSVPLETAVEPDEDLAPVCNPDEALIQTRSGRIIKPFRRQEFDYSYMLSCFYLLGPSSFPASLEAHLQSCTSSWPPSFEANFRPCSSIHSSLEVQPQPSPSRALFPSTCVSALPQVPTAVQENKFRREQRARAARLGESVHCLLDSDSVERLAFVAKSTGTLFYLDF